MAAYRTTTVDIDVNTSAFKVKLNPRCEVVQDDSQVLTAAEVVTYLTVTGSAT